MASVTFPPEVGGDGSTVTDSAGANGLAAGGHRTRFVPALTQVVNVAAFVAARALEVLSNKNAAQSAQQAAEVAAAAASSSASEAAGFTGTSASTLAVSNGNKTLTIQAGKQFTLGVRVSLVKTGDLNVIMQGAVLSYNVATGAMSVAVDSHTGEGSHSSWIVSIAGAKGAPGAPVAWLRKSAAYTAIAADYILADTSVAGFVVTLPAAPSVGNEVVVQDVRGSFNTNPLTVTGGTILTSLTDTDTSVTIDVSGRFSFIFDSNAGGWIISRLATGVQ